VAPGLQFCDSQMANQVTSLIDRLAQIRTSVWPVATALGLLAVLRRRSPVSVLFAVIAGSVAYRAMTRARAGSQTPGKRPGRGDMPSLTEGRGIKVERTITIARPAHELYQFWRRLENLPRVLPHVTSVTTTSPTRSHWVAAGPAGTTVEWDAEIVGDRADDLIAWRSVDGSDVDLGGSITFTPLGGDRGTEAKIVLNVAPPAGRVGGLVALAFGEHPDQEVLDGLRRFKQIMESAASPAPDTRPRGQGAA
jgi:uncharacterized membrane protein